ncbi:MAG: hypothetical protein PHQ36_06395 [Anaerolineales bacterium]|nr:hypothetical protein [Anaerolineales bacterium]
MDSTNQPEAQETKAQDANLQERAVEPRADTSLPAAQAIKAQNDAAEQNSAPRFIP